MGQPSDMLKSILLICGIVPLISLLPKPDAQVRQRRPNILFAIADDHSFPHASAYGSKMFRTPNFDRVASEGALFYNAFVAAPQ
jgi:N-sulfoglucosamine sulfohydrolase